MAEKGKEKKTEEEYEKEYSTKIGVFTKSLESEKADKLLIELIEVIPREIKIQTLKDKYVELFHTLLVKLKEEGIKNVVASLKDSNIPKFYAYLNKATQMMVTSSFQLTLAHAAVFNASYLSKTMQIFNEKKGYAGPAMFMFRRDLTF